MYNNNISLKTKVMFIGKKMMSFKNWLTIQIIMTLSVALSLIVGFAGQSIQAANKEPLEICGFVQWGYVLDGKLPGVKLEQLTNLVYSYVYVTSSTDSTLISKYMDGVNKCVTAGHAKGIKVSLSLYGTTDLGILLANASLRANLVSNLATIASTNNIDGINIDYEDAYNPDYQNNLNLFIPELYAAIHPMGLQLMQTVCWRGPGFPVNSVSNAQYLDMISVDAYRSHTLSDAILWLTPWTDAGWPANKIILGCLTDGEDASKKWVATYKDIIDQFNPAPDQSQITADYINSTFYGKQCAVSGGVIKFDCINQIKQKVNYIKTSGFRGIMLFDVCQDKLNDDRSLLKAVYDEMNQTPAPEPAYVEIAPASSTSASGQIKSLSFSSFSTADASAIQEVNTPFVPEGGKLQYVAKGYDAENNPISGLKYAWKVTDPTAGSITSNGVFTAGPNPGSFTGVIQAITPGGMIGTASVTVIDSPLVSIGNQSVDEGQLLQFKVSKDQDNSGLTFSASNLPVGSDFDASTQIFSWTPALNQAGTYSVIFQATDGTYIDSESISIIVNNTNSAPVIDSIGNKTAKVSTKLTFTVTARDADGDRLIYSASNLPQGATFNASTRVFSWTPSRTQIGTYANISFRVTDGKLTDSESITITVKAVNKAPVIGSIRNQTVTAGNPLTFTVNASDANGDSLTYSASSLPSGAMFDTTTHKFSWTPTASQKGTYRNVRFLVNDGTTTVAKNITITVKTANQAPTLNTISNKTVKAGSTLMFAVSGSDPNGDKLTYSATNMPKGATFNAATRTFTWKPTTSQKGTYDGVVFKVSDGSLSATSTISILVN